MSNTAIALQQVSQKRETSYKILIIIGICHLLNDSIQAIIPAMFPILEKSMGLTFTQLGMIAFALNIVSSILQPVIGMVTDKRPMPFALPIALSCTMVGVLGLSLAPNFELIVLSVLFIGLGSAIFHPEGSRVAYLAAGSRRGLAQSIYQVGGNSGQAMAPLITALILVPLGQIGAAWFTIVAGAAVALLLYIAFWYSNTMKLQQTSQYKKEEKTAGNHNRISRKIWFALFLILFLIFARSWYIAGMTNYYAFFTIETYSFSIKQSQIFLFTFLVAGALGTFFGGPLADRFGKKMIIFLSMIISAPLTIAIPFVPPVAAFCLLFLTGFILMSSFSVTVVYAQELVPGKIGTMAGLTVGLAFGMGAIGAIVIGYLADLIGIVSTMVLTGFLPLLGLLTLLLPSDQTLKKWHS
ncbi:FSR family fosmidomycin resistance protein-like MFS transporter [Cytobacillus eiseniae]|uniref:FSR family fosmidomycin resistance protein-like MFS transporter n=1 Tax=Cytobacillus eiseniae TaxID=762947 RepID=A0ABS4RAK1_9BACI|nr:MFS transporter [Cytobacillus eiseniae]MBP2239922.1 FSR family fosmidomycin resistance protein-like MFS transporter [Cytobacillus eiseniae]